MSKYKHNSNNGKGPAHAQLELLSQAAVAQQFNHTKTPAKASAGGYKRCYESHPALTLTDDIVIYGGSCMYPMIEDADIYIGHDLSMAKSIKSYPWEQGESVLFHIPDMGVPASVDQYKKMLDWLVVQLTAHKKVHVGCIGGHGRTGTTLAALIKLMTGNTKAIEYVRANYCEKAVESQSQINFLHQHFGVEKASPAKGGHDYASHTPAAKPGLPARVPYESRAALPSFSLAGTSTIYPAEGSKSSVWGANIEIVKAKNT